jgi:ribosomal protein S18 acetylase RimI-like enzyme
MEIANLWANTAANMSGVRIAEPDDVRVITKLLRQASYAHLHADWHYPGDWLGTPGFVVMDKIEVEEVDGSLASRLFGFQQGLQACLAVAADPPPAAWVRVAAVDDFVQGRQVLAAMLAAVADSLQQASVQQLCWLLIESWPEEWLRDLGFKKENFVETYVKQEGQIPEVAEVPGLLIRAVKEIDLQRLEQIEADAFEPLWRHSASSLALARQHALSFDVAELNGAIVGYQFSTPVESGVHLARMTVVPSAQGSGVGTQLLAHACAEYERRGFKFISLNTQADNHASQKLYRRFGFRPNGQRFPIWIVDL